MGDIAAFLSAINTLLHLFCQKDNAVNQRFCCSSFRGLLNNRRSSAETSAELDSIAHLLILSFVFMLASWRTRPEWPWSQIHLKRDSVLLRR